MNLSEYDHVYDKLIYEYRKEKEVIRQIREKREKLESYYSKGMLSFDELLRQKTILYHDLTIMVSESDPEENIISPEELLDLCGLEKEELISGNANHELDHDSLTDGSVYVFKGLSGLEQLIRENDPEGKCFTFQLPLTRSGERIWKDFLFEVRQKKAGEDRWQGWMIYEGLGRFSIYSGEGSLIVHEEAGMIQSVLYQKCYI